jgi:hypothetical protein
MADQVLVTIDGDDVTVVTAAEQGPAGPAGSSVPATPSSLGGVIVGNTLTADANGILNLPNLTTAGSAGNATRSIILTLDAQGRVLSATPVLITPDWTNVTGKPLFATVATSGLYSDLTGLPNLSVYQLQSTNTWANLTGKPTLANVATSGAYADLSGTPNLSIYQTIATNTFANLSGAPNMSLYYFANNPTGFITSSALSPYLQSATAAATYLPTANFTFNNITGKPTTLSGYGITDAYASSNPSGFITASALTTYAPLASPSLTGTPTAPTAANGTATTQLATTAFVAAAISGYVTASTANSTYAPITTTVTLTGVQTLTNKTISGGTLSGSTTFQGDSDLSGYLLQHAAVLPKTVSATAYTLTQADCGSTLILTGTSAQTITVPTGLMRGYNVTIFQKSAFSSTISAASGVTLYAKNGLKTSGQNALIGIVDTGDANPPTGFAVGGDTAT